MVGASDKILHKGSIWTGHRAVLYFIFHKSTFLNFVHNGTIFYVNYISLEYKKKYIDDDGSGVFPKQKDRKLYNSKHQKTYPNRYYVLKNDYIKDTRICWTCSEIKRRATGYVYLYGSPYRDAEGSSQLR